MKNWRAITYSPISILFPLVQNEDSAADECIDNEYDFRNIKILQGFYPS
ncbi:hypothetical protein [Epilithonimonas hominis]|nr:hypothetical protein [Epilithonimonas hominis]